MPLTASLYVPGVIASANQVLVDIGTGYYVNKTTEEAVELIDRKIQMVVQRAASIQERVSQQRKNLETIVFVMKTRLNASNQRGEKQPQEE